jgi:hypothetical protein
MREFAKISSEFWTSSLGKKIKNCELEAKVMTFYLMTCRHANMMGVYYLPLSFASHETGIPLEGLTRGIEALAKVGFCSYDEETEYVWVHEMAASQLGMLKKNDNRVKYVNNLFSKLPELSFLADFYEKYCDLLHLEIHKNFVSKVSPFEAIENREGRIEIREERLEIKKTPNIFLGGEQTVSAVDEEEEISVKNVITFPVKTKSSVVFTVPLRQGKPRMITEIELDEWQKNYPGVDVRQEIRQLTAWNQANPDRQKTERGINRHIQGWLAHAQQKQSNSRAIQHPISTWDHNVAVINALLEEDHGS